MAPFIKYVGRVNSGIADGTLMAKVHNPDFSQNKTKITTNNENASSMRRDLNGKWILPAQNNIVNPHHVNMQSAGQYDPERRCIGRP